jgi:hypothetical protein
MGDHQRPVKAVGKRLPKDASTGDRPGILVEWCRWRANQLLREHGWSPGDLRRWPRLLELLTADFGLQVVEVDQVACDAALDLAAATIRVRRGLTGLRRTFAITREYAHARMHRVAVDQLEELTDKHRAEAELFAQALLDL